MANIIDRINLLRRNLIIEKQGGIDEIVYIRIYVKHHHDKIHALLLHDLALLSTHLRQVFIRNIEQAKIFVHRQDIRCIVKPGIEEAIVQQRGILLFVNDIRKLVLDTILLWHTEQIGVCT